MLQTLVLRFLKDRMLLIVVYLINLACILGFFHLSEPANTEVFYPLSIGLFLLMIYLFMDWFRFYPTNRTMAFLLKDQYAEWQPSTEEQKTFQKLLDKLVHEQTQRYNELKEQSNERFYFLSHWMHHLKTPVSVIELMINKEEKSVVLDKIQQENQRMHRSIEQGLTSIRMDRFENDIEIQTVDLLLSLRKLINARKKEWIYQSIYPSIQFEGNDAFIITDPKWNDMLIDQIISNGIKYSKLKEGSHKLIFRVEKQDDHIQLAIIDEGVGIPAYDLERVFEPFFTGENGRKHSDSTGIGLYLSKKIADRIGAKLTIQSKAGEGTTVTIRWIAKKQT